MESQIERIKANLSVLEAWRILDLPGEPHIGDQRSPFRKDKKASFTIFRINGATKWFDHGIGEGGDSIDLWRVASGLAGAKEAIADILQRIPALDVSEPILGRFAPREEKPSSPKAIRWPPDLRAPTEDECRVLGKLRGLKPGTFWLASHLGTLKVATVYGSPAWIITDASGICAEARRFDGGMYTVNGKEVKGFALPGSKKHWPLGLLTNSQDVNRGKRLLLAEGGPDYFAALQLCTLVDGVRPIAMLGAGLRIGPEAKKFIWGAEVLIIPHNDPAGRKSEGNWVHDLRSLGASRILVQHLPFEINDLNEFLSHNPQEPEALLKGFQSESNPGTSRV
jgi:hypothetical protein